MTVITGHVFKQIFKNDTPKLLNAKKAIFDQVYVPLDVPRVGNILLQNRRKQTEGQTYMIKIAIIKQEQVSYVNRIVLETLKNRYPKLSRVLSRAKQLYTIKIKPDAKAFSFKTQWKNATAPQSKYELQKMEQMGVISHVEKATEWCEGKVWMVKKSGEPCIFFWSHKTL